MRRFLVALVLGLSACATSATDRVQRVEEHGVFPGGRYWRENRTDPAMQIHVLELDLRRVRLDVSAGDRSKGREFIARTTSAYVTEQKLLAAVNGGYFLPFKGGSKGGEDYYPHAGDPVDVSGASIADGVVVSPVETDIDERVNAIVCIDGASVEIRDGQTCAEGVDDAMAAGPRLLADGARRSFDKFGLVYAQARHPRTAVGLDKDSPRAWLVVVDGRQEGLSEGASLDELTAIFEQLGAENAINLDGGGSTTLIIGDGAGSAKVVSSPIHTGVPGRERPSANHLGVRAAR